MGAAVDQHPVVRFEFGSTHGWYIGCVERWGLLPGDDTAWPAQWSRYVEATDVGLADLRFATSEHRVEFVRDVGI